VTAVGGARWQRHWLVLSDQQHQGHRDSDRSRDSDSESSRAAAAVECLSLCKLSLAGPVVLSDQQHQGHSDSDRHRDSDSESSQAAVKCLSRCESDSERSLSRADWCRCELSDSERSRPERPGLGRRLSWHNFARLR
jgi:hypothetical protein